MPEERLVQLQLTTKIFQDGGDERYDFDTQGHLIVRNGAVYLNYDEELPDQEIVQVRFKIRADRIRLNRRAENYRTSLVFALNQKVPATYPTPAGKIEIETQATRLDWQFDEAKAQGELALDYVLYANQTAVGQNQVRLQFQP
ncbi:DUF1934 domain-containing protein [Lactobacillaceae bacterium L1_55_11]|nr:DUF1934 domain-containing protein [Lactobacillaceae bacterium L1_55_11]